MQEPIQKVSKMTPAPLRLRIFVKTSTSMSSENSDLCQISDLVLFDSYFVFQSKGIKFGDGLFDVSCVN